MGVPASYYAIGCNIPVGCIMHLPSSQSEAALAHKAYSKESVCSGFVCVDRQSKFMIWKTFWFPFLDTVNQISLSQGFLY